MAGAGARLEAVRRAGQRLRDRLCAGPAALCIRTFDIATFPYPTRFGLGGVARSPAPYLFLRNRMQLVQTRWQGRVITILVNPSDPTRSLEAPFFARQRARYGEFLSTRVLARRHGEVARALAEVGVAPEAVDFITFDHLHVQDVRGLLGTSEPEPGRTGPTPPLLPNARLLVQRAELETLARLHPLQVPWYVRDGIRGVPRQRFVVLDGDHLVGEGAALVRTPGHTAGNHSIVLHAATGLWTISENGIAAECYAPECSAIPGLRQHARSSGEEAILNANTREQSLDQYTSMVLEKTLADPSQERPEFPQHFASSELVASPLAPGLAPTFCHRTLHHGEVVRSGRAGQEPSAA